MRPLPERRGPSANPEEENAVQSRNEGWPAAVVRNRNKDWPAFGDQNRHEDWPASAVVGSRRVADGEHLEDEKTMLGGHPEEDPEDV